MDWLARNFILRARRAPTTPSFAPNALPEANHLEAVVQAILHALFHANTHRADTTLNVVLEGGAQAPKLLRFRGDSLGSMRGLDEHSIAEVMLEALRVGLGMAAEEERVSDRGVVVARRSFDALVKEASEEGVFHFLHRRGVDIRGTRFSRPAIFVLSDHLAMPRKSEQYMKRLGGVALSVGPKLLFAAQCIVLIHNELDRGDP